MYRLGANCRAINSSKTEKSYNIVGEGKRYTKFSIEAQRNEYTI
jgi:hypothetical protein